MIVAILLWTASLASQAIVAPPRPLTPARETVEPPPAAVAYGILLAAYPELRDGQVAATWTTEGARLRIVAGHRADARLVPASAATPFPELTAEFTFDDRHALIGFAASGVFARSHERSELDRRVATGGPGDASAYLARFNAAYGPTDSGRAIGAAPLQELERTLGRLTVTSATYSDRGWRIAFRAGDIQDARTVNVLLEPFSGRVVALEVVGGAR